MTKRSRSFAELSVAVLFRNGCRLGTADPGSKKGGFYVSIEIAAMSFLGNLLLVIPDGRLGVKL